MGADVIVTNFTGETVKPKGILPVDLKVGSRERKTAFFVVDTAAAYNALLGRDWIHSNYCIPSSLHQFLVLWNIDAKEGEEEIYGR